MMAGMPIRYAAIGDSSIIMSERHLLIRVPAAVRNEAPEKGEFGLWTRQEDAWSKARYLARKHGSMRSIDRLCHGGW